MSVKESSNTKQKNSKVPMRSEGMGGGDNCEIKI